MIGVYHSRDFDGICSGAIMKFKYPDIKLYGYDYGMEKNIDVKNEDVIISDFSFPMSVMKEIADESNSLIWVDHHITQINEYKKHEPFCEAILTTDYSACESLWNYLFPNSEVPLIVKFLSDYDSWHNLDKVYWNDFVLPFQYGLKVMCNSVDSFPTDLLKRDEGVLSIIEIGKYIMKYNKLTNESIAKSSSFECMFMNYRTICINTPLFSSSSFDSVYDENKYDLMLAYQFNGKVWKFSIYSTKESIDGSSISKKFGGGGHKGASGFMIKAEDFSDFFENNIRII